MWQFGEERGWINEAQNKLCRFWLTITVFLLWHKKPPPGKWRKKSFTILTLTLYLASMQPLAKGTHNKGRRRMIRPVSEFCGDHSHKELVYMREEQSVAKYTTRVGVQALTHKRVTAPLARVDGSGYIPEGQSPDFSRCYLRWIGGQPR